jgi:hypothetical protein
MTPSPNFEPSITSNADPAAMNIDPSHGPLHGPEPDRAKSAGLLT